MSAAGRGDLASVVFYAVDADDSMRTNLLKVFTPRNDTCRIGIRAGGQLALVLLDGPQLRCLAAALLARAEVMAARDREALGRRVRDVWVEWAREQPNPKPSWLLGWDQLDDAEREVDMRIGEALLQPLITPPGGGR